MSNLIIDDSNDLYGIKAVLSLVVPSHLRSHAIVAKSVMVPIENGNFMFSSMTRKHISEDINPWYFREASTRDKSVFTQQELDSCVYIDQWNIGEFLPRIRAELDSIVSEITGDTTHDLRVSTIQFLKTLYPFEPEALSIGIHLGLVRWKDDE